MAKDRPVEPPRAISRGISRAVYALARQAGFTARQALALERLGGTLSELRRADPDAVSRTAEVDRAAAERLIHAAGLAGLTGISTELAVALADRRVTLEVLAREEPEKVAERLRDLPEIDISRLAAWGVSAAGVLRRTQPPSRPPVEPDLRPPKLPKPKSYRRTVVAKQTTWAELAQSLYGLEGREASAMARALAAANRSRPDTTVAAGTLVILLESSRAKPKLPAPEQSIERLRAFAPHLQEDEARQLVESGITSPDLLLATVRAPSAAGYGVDVQRLQQLQMQAQLATLDGMSSELAYYFAVERPRSLQELARENPVELSAELEAAKALGKLHESADISAANTRKWLGELVGAVVEDPGWVEYLPAETATCATEVPASAFLENYYTYRFAPAGKTSEQLQGEINAKHQWLTEVDTYLGEAPSAVRTTNFLQQGLLIGRLHFEDLKPWGGSVWSLTSVDTLTIMRDFMRENVKICQLLQALSEGHEAYRFREYGLSLAAYDRVERWFTAISPRQNPPGVAERWWRNEPDAGGVHKPSFLVIYELLPGDPGVQASYKPIHDYYANRNTAGDRNTLLETLHVDVPDYHRWRINPAVEGSPGVPFRKFLYYVYNFALPMLRGDCYSRLGNFCAALDHYFRVYREDAFTQPLDNAHEDDMVRGVENTTGPVVRYDSLLTFSTTAPAEDRYYAPYLNNLERRAVRLRVSETLLSWGDLHFRRGERSEARARYAQVLRILNAEWTGLRSVAFDTLASYRAQVDALSINPRAAELAMSANQELLKIARSLNYLGYPDDYVPIWTYMFLLTTARYFADRARQLGRDALQFRSTAEQEQGNRRLLQQSVAITQGQLATESRRVDEADAAVAVAEAGDALAAVRAANNEDRKEELEAFGPTRQALGIVGGSIGGASSGASLGGIGGGAGAAAGAVLGATYGGISAYISGCIEMQAQRNELERQRLELDKASAMAGAEVSRATIGASVARLARNVAALNSIFAQSNLEFAQAKTLNAEFWFETSLRLADFASTYLERAIGVAFLTEQAFEFMDGRRLDVIKFDYSQSEGVLAADALQSDLDSVEYERVAGRLSKTTPVKHVVRLREKDFFGFSELKRTGFWTFDSALYDFDSAHPGGYQQRIASVEVEVRALVPPEGIRGTLRKSGLSYLRYRVGAAGTGAAPPNTAPDWVEHTPTSYRMAPVIQPDETLILSAYDVRRDAVVLRPDPGEQLRVFEGAGVAASWTVSLKPCSTEVNLATITDVNLIIYYYSQFDEGLARAVSLERRKLMGLGSLLFQRTRGFSLREIFPDAMYQLHNPPLDAPDDPWRQRTIQIPVQPGLFPPGQIRRRLKGITLVFVGVGDYLDVRASLSKGTLALAAAAFQAAGDDPRIRTALGQDHAPDGTWELTIRASDNVAAIGLPALYRVDTQGKVVLDSNRQPIADSAGVPAFDPAKVMGIKDVWLIFNYQYDEGGECGEPVEAWAHFWNSATPYYTTTGTKLATTWITDDIAGVGTWGLAQGRMVQTAAARTILTLAAGVSWSEVAVTAAVSLPAAAGATTGLVFRYRAPGGGQQSGDFYLARLTRLVNGHLEVALDVRAAGVVTTLARTELAALASLTDFDLAGRAQGTQLEVHLNGRVALRATDATAAAGTIGLYAEGAGVGFAEVLVANLTGR